APVLERGHTPGPGGRYQRGGIQIVAPKVRRGLGIIPFEWPARTVASRLHAEEQHPVTIGEKVGGLPGGLIGNIKLAKAKACAVGVDQRGSTLRDEKEACRTPDAGLPTGHG